MIEEKVKEKIYLIPGLMTDERLWSRIKPLLENEYELIHIPIPHTEDFDEIIDILEKLFSKDSEEKVNLLGFFSRRLYCYLVCNYLSK